MDQNELTALRDRQNQSLRDPQQVISSSFSEAGIVKESLKLKANKSFIALLEALKITLFVTREYENMVVALTAAHGTLTQTILPLPHPSGIAADRKNGLLYIASTRNPNYILEMIAVKDNASKTSFMLPARQKYYPGAYYFHDLAFIGDKLYANSVGQNGVVEVTMDCTAADPVCWTPASIGKRTERNHIQLNSIAAGKTLKDSFFSASAAKPIKQKPGEIDFPVDKKGVIFSGATGEVICTGLTRPHSAKMINRKLWVNNSGYGEVGFVQNSIFAPVSKQDGWTRGLCAIKGIAFVGISRILPRFAHYAPGVDANKAYCGLVAIDLKTGKTCGKLEWPCGNQVFGIDYLNSEQTKGFMFENTAPSNDDQKNLFYRTRAH
jgi:uncharacterized protein (TIGR03032 family)